MNDIKKILSNTAPSVTCKQVYNTFDLVPILMSMNISLGYDICAYRGGVGQKFPKTCTSIIN